MPYYSIIFAYKKKLIFDFDRRIRMGEIWKEVSGFPDYFVSNLGNVKSIKKGKECFIKPQLVGKKYRYYQVGLCQEGKVSQVKVHRLVALAFCENPDNKPVIDHLNRDKLDNRAENLCWKTQSENCINTPDKTSTRNIHIDKGKYFVQIKRMYKIVYCKSFETLEEAIQARDLFLAQTT